MANKEVRKLKVYGQSGTNHKLTPTITLKGAWLKEVGFEIGRCVQIKCENERLIITRDVEREELLKAEEEFVQKEKKRLNRELELNRIMYRNQMVAEKKSQFGNQNSEVTADEK